MLLYNSPTHHLPNQLLTLRPDVSVDCRGDLLVVSGVLPDQNLRVVVHAGMDAQADGPPYGLGHLPLVRRP